MALMLALNSPELDVRAITVVPGNVTAQQGLDNALRMVSLANRCDIPVAAGASTDAANSFAGRSVGQSPTIPPGFSAPPARIIVEAVPWSVPPVPFTCAVRPNSVTAIATVFAKGT